MANLDFLIHYNVFCKTEVGFLPVVHTHNDIDNAFLITCSVYKLMFQ